MKNLFVFVILILATFTQFSKCDSYYWTNGEGDNDFTKGLNWLDKYDDNFTSSDDFQIDMDSPNQSVIGINGASAVGRWVLVAKINNSVGDLRVIGGVSNFSKGLSIGGNLSDALNAQGYFTVSGGEINFPTSFISIGQNGYGNMEVTGGTCTADRGNIASGTSSQGELSISAGLFELTNLFQCGLRGTATMEVTGGEFTAGTMFIGDTSTSNGSLTVSSNGNVNISEFMTVGRDGTGSLEVTGGVVNADRSTIGQNAGSYGQITINGGELNYESAVELGRNGDSQISIIGNTGKFRCDYLYGANNSLMEFKLNGSFGVGNGIEGKSGTTELNGEVDVSFLTGTETTGDYLLVSGDTVVDGNEPGLLSSASISAGWNSNIVDLGPLEGLMVSYDAGSTEVLWTNSTGDQLWSTSGNWNASLGTDDIALIDSQGSNGAILNSAETVNTAVIGNVSDGTLEVQSGANGDFIQLYIAREPNSTGAVTVSDGSLSVVNISEIGQDGSGDLVINGGMFDTGHLFIAMSDNSTGKVSISNSADLVVDGICTIGNGGRMEVNGFQATIDIGRLATEAGSLIDLEFDGSLGIGNGFIADGDIDLEGSISISFIGGLNNWTPGTYTIMTTSEEITDNTGGNLITTPFCNYEIVTESGMQYLRVTVSEPQDCQDLIDAGYKLSADLYPDCKIDIKDFAELAVKWLLCNDPEVSGCDWTLID